MTVRGTSSTGWAARLRRAMEGLPRWAVALLGCACAVLGAVLTVRPFASLGTLLVFSFAVALTMAVTDLVAAARSGRGGLQTLTAAAWLLLAVAVVALPSWTVAAFAVAAGCWLLAGGVLDLVRAWRGSTDARVLLAVEGVTGVVLGVLALSWPDVTLLVIAVAVGVRTFLFGCRTVVSSLRGARHGEPDDVRPRRRHRRLRTLGAVLSLVAAAVLAAVSMTLHRGEPSVTAFYTAPAAVPDQPGRLVRSEPFTTAVPAAAVAWRILYTTTRDDGRPAVASGLVLTSRTGPAARPVLAWAHGTTGVDPSCAPSLLKNPFAAGALPALDGIVKAGWALVATDYTGLGTDGPHPYLIGRGEARAVLDAVRAARMLDGLALSAKTVVWGHSQGGHAALWTGQIAPSYAPDVPLAGVAALAPASDLKALVSNLDRVPGGAIFAAYVLTGYRDHYGDVTERAYLRPTAVTLVHRWAARCLAEPEVFVSIPSSLMLDKPVFRTSPVNGPFGKRLAENTPRGRIAAPVLLAQGLTDPLVLPSVQRAYAAASCAAGNRVDHVTVAGRDHTGIVADDSPLVPELLRWTTDRFAGRPAAPGCLARTLGG